MIVTSLEPAIEKIRHSPHFPEVLSILQTEWEKERLLRQAFYQDMTPEQKIEFIDGTVILHSPARNRHLDVTTYIAKLLHTFVDTHDLGTVKVEKCLVVFPRNDYEPDVVFFDRNKMADFDDTTMRFPIPDLAVEVLSSSTEKRDRGVKFNDFAANGVGEYWIVDAEQGILEQYILINHEYDLKIKSSSGKICSKVVGGFEVDIEAFFDRKKNLEALRSIIQE